MTARIGRSEGRGRMRTEKRNGKIRGTFQTPTRMSLGMDAGWNEARRVTPPVFRSSPWKVLTLGDALGPQWLPWPQADTLQGTFLLLRLGDQVMWTISVEKIRLGVQRC